VLFPKDSTRNTPVLLLTGCGTLAYTALAIAKQRRLLELGDRDLPKHWDLQWCSTISHCVPLALTGALSEACELLGIGCVLGIESSLSAFGPRDLVQCCHR